MFVFPESLDVKIYNSQGFYSSYETLIYVMKPFLLKLNIVSKSDVITNSSSELFLVRTDELNSETIQFPDGFPIRGLTKMTVKDLKDWNRVKKTGEYCEPGKINLDPELCYLGEFILNTETLNSKEFLFEHIPLLKRYFQNPKICVKQDLLDEETGEIEYDESIFVDLDPEILKKSVLSFSENYVKKDSRLQEIFNYRVEYYRKDYYDAFELLQDIEWSPTKCFFSYCKSNPDNLIPDPEHLFRLYGENFITEEDIEEGKVWYMNGLDDNWFSSNFYRYGEDSAFKLLDEMFGENNYYIVR